MKKSNLPSSCPLVTRNLTPSNAGACRFHPDILQCLFDAKVLGGDEGCSLVDQCGLVRRWPNKLERTKMLQPNNLQHEDKTNLGINKAGRAVMADEKPRNKNEPGRRATGQRQPSAIKTPDDPVQLELPFS